MTDQDRNLLLAERLDLEINEEMSSEIDRCLSTYLIAMNDVDIAATIFKDFGKGLIKKCGVSPDAFVQMAIQLANYRIGVCYRFAGNHSIFAHISSYKSANNTVGRGIFLCYIYIYIYI
uniref:Carn_acyltransf domain-containing protein n=1 Tax=Heterorhabditis bacteriophora TaxID=37862 RepID=A0A1I7XIN5_HETBA